jgi:hypothetical protein
MSQTTPELNISLEGTVRQFSLGRAQADHMGQMILAALTTTIGDRLRLLAGQGLRSTRNEYLQSIVVLSDGPLQNTIALTGRLAPMLELGATAYDMKQGLLASSRVKYTKDGKPYLTVPFRHGTPGALGENAAFSSIMPAEIYRAVQRLAAYTSQPGQSPSGGQALRTPPAPYNQRQIRPTITQNTGVLTPAQLAAYQHASPQYAGLRREEKTYERATQSQYVTFRRVSLRSAVNAWIHPGLAARRFMPQAVASSNVSDLVARTIDAVLDSYNL